MLRSSAESLSRKKLGALLYNLRSWVTFFAALLPMAGAVLGGIRESGDFERFSARSTKTVAALEELAGEVTLAKRKLRLDITLDVSVLDRPATRR